MQVGQEIEVRPGIVSKDNEGKLTCRPIFAQILSLFAEQNDLQFAVPGGLIGNDRDLERAVFIGSFLMCLSTSQVLVQVLILPYAELIVWLDKFWEL